MGKEVRLTQVEPGSQGPIAIRSKWRNMHFLKGSLDHFALPQ
jgi:hypothetical protein